MGQYYDLHEDDAEMLLRSFMARYTFGGWQLAHDVRGVKEWYAVDEKDAATLKRVNARLAEASVDPATRAVNCSCRYIAWQKEGERCAS